MRTGHRSPVGTAGDRETGVSQISLCSYPSLATWLGSPGASTPSIHRPCRPPGAAGPALPAGDEPALVVAPGDARPLRVARPRAVAELRRRPGQGRSARSRAERLAAAGQGPHVPAPAAGRRRRPAGLPRRAALVPVAGRRGAGQHRLLLRRVRHHRGAARSTPAAWASSPATTSRPPPTSASRSSASGCSTAPATSRRASPPTAGSWSTTRRSTRTACR